jgi:Tfp pilus assembly protein PilN
MKAVNLIPAEERRGAGGAAGRTGGAAYVLIGALVLVVAMLAAYATTTKSVNDRQAELATVQQQLTESQAQASALAPYTQFAALRAARVATINSIADSRFNWAHAMHELGRTLPHDITLTALTGTVSSQAAGASGGASVALRAAYDVPAIELAGCAPGQAAIPPMLASLRQVDGVRRVALQQSVKGAVGAAAPTSTTGTKAVRTPNCSRTFSAVIFYDPKPQPSAVGAAPAPVARGTPVAQAAPAAPATGTTQNVSGGAK